MVDAALLATNGASAFFRAATQTDADGDGLSDAEERWTYHTDPANPDSDGDNLCDGWEINLVNFHLRGVLLLESMVFQLVEHFKEMLSYRDQINEIENKFDFLGCFLVNVVGGRIAV